MEIYLKKRCAKSMEDLSLNKERVAEDILIRSFGHQEFRPHQRSAILKVLEKRDVLAVLQTGGGKSLLYELPALCFPIKSLTVVVSPLLSLQKDQYLKLKEKGIPTLQWNSTVSKKEKANIKAGLLYGRTDAKILYTTPESLVRTSSGKGRIEQKERSELWGILKDVHEMGNLKLFAIDEAHCIVDWGHDFRGDYLKLGKLRKHFGGTPIIALTASANLKVQEAIISSLNLENVYQEIGSFNRANIFYRVKYKDLLLSTFKSGYGKSGDYSSSDGEEQNAKSVCWDDVLEYALAKKKLGHRGIIYCRMKVDVEGLCKFLGANGINACFYHADVKATRKEEIQKQWRKRKIDVLVATLAFGLGVDVPDVRFVIHTEFPGCISSYYQESGRAGRDGAPAESILYFSWDDYSHLENILQNQYFTKKHGEVKKKEFQRITSIYFGQSIDQHKGKRCCDFCEDKVGARARLDEFNERKPRKYTFKDMGKHTGLSGVAFNTAKYNSSSSETDSDIERIIKNKPEKKKKKKKKKIKVKGKRKRKVPNDDGPVSLTIDKFFKKKKRKTK